MRRLLVLLMLAGACTPPPNPDLPATMDDDDNDMDTTNPGPSGPTDMIDDDDDDDDNQNPTVVAGLSVSVVGADVVADGATAFILTARVFDVAAPETALAGVEVSLSGDPALSIQGSPALSDGAGEVLFTVVSTTVGSFSATATLTASALTDTTTLTFIAGPVSLAHATLDVSRARANANGTSQITVSAHTFDAYGHTVGGVPVALDFTGDGNAFDGAISGDTDADGSFSVGFASSVAESKHITLFVDGDEAMATDVSFGEPWVLGSGLRTGMPRFSAEYGAHGLIKSTTKELYHTTDGGQTLLPWSDGAPDHLGDNTNAVAAALVDGEVCFYTVTGVGEATVAVRCTNDVAWQTLGGGDAFPDDAQLGTLYALDDDSHAVYAAFGARVADGAMTVYAYNAGSAWTALPSAGLTTNGIAEPPLLRVTNALYYGAVDGLYRLQNGGTAWTVVTGSPNVVVSGLAHDSRSGLIYLSGSNALWRYDPSGTWIDSNDGWQDITAGLPMGEFCMIGPCTPTPPSIGAIAVDNTTNPSTLYVRAHGVHLQIAGPTTLLGVAIYTLSSIDFDTPAWTETAGPWANPLPAGFRLVPGVAGVAATQLHFATEDGYEAWGTANEGNLTQAKLDGLPSGSSRGIAVAPGIGVFTAIDSRLFATLDHGLTWQSGVSLGTPHPFTRVRIGLEDGVSTRLFGTTYFFTISEGCSLVVKNGDAAWSEQEFAGNTCKLATSDRDTTDAAAVANGQIYVYDSVGNTFVLDNQPNVPSSVHAVAFGDLGDGPILLATSDRIWTRPIDGGSWVSVGDTFPMPTAAIQELATNPSNGDIWLVNGSLLRKRGDETGVATVAVSGAATMPAFSIVRAISDGSGFFLGHGLAAIEPEAPSAFFIHANGTIESISGGLKNGVTDFGEEGDRWWVTDGLQGSSGPIDSGVKMSYRGGLD